MSNTQTYNVVFYNCGELWSWPFDNFSNACYEAKQVAKYYHGITCADVIDGVTGEILQSFYPHLDIIDRDLFDLEREILG